MCLKFGTQVFHVVPGYAYKKIGFGKIVAFFVHIHCFWPLLTIENSEYGQKGKHLTTIDFLLQTQGQHDTHLCAKF